MSEVSVDRNPITVGTDLDRAILQVRRLTIPLPYASANVIAANLTLASNHCANLVHNERPDRGAIECRLELDPEAPVVHERRRGTMPGKFNWRIDVDSEQVMLRLSGHCLKLHFMDAARLALEIKAKAKIAKAWAGDTGKQFIVTGHLEDAEVNYKRGIN